MIVQIFFSYSHKDEKLMHEVRKQLVPFEREGIIVKWYDREIQAGKEWDEEIKAHLLSAQIILLFVSPDFLASRYCYNLEMKEALERHKRGEAVVVPIILRPCLWQETPLGELQALPQDGKPVTTWRNKDEATTNVATRIMDIVRGLKQAPDRQGDSPGGLAVRGNAAPRGRRGREENIARKKLKDWAIIVGPIVILLAALIGVWGSTIQAKIPISATKTAEALATSQAGTMTLTSTIQSPSVVMFQLGIWGIDYFSNAQLDPPSVYHAEQTATVNNEGGYTLTFNSLDAQTNPEIPKGNMGVRFSGKFYFTDGYYEFHCVHHDGCRVYLDSKIWIDAWWDGPGGHDAGGDVTEGYHLVVVEFYDKGGFGSLEVRWNKKP